MTEKEESLYKRDDPENGILSMKRHSTVEFSKVLIRGFR